MQTSLVTLQMAAIATVSVVVVVVVVVAVVVVVVVVVVMDLGAKRIVHKPLRCLLFEDVSGFCHSIGHKNILIKKSSNAKASDGHCSHVTLETVESLKIAVKVR